MLPGSPAAYQVGIGDQHAGGVFMRTQYAYRLSALYHQGLVFIKVAQAFQDLIKTLPVAGSLADTAINDQIFGTFSHFGIQVILDHTVGSLGYPIFTM